MHKKKYLYIKGIHIKLIFKNNLLRCFIYNYGESDNYIVYEKDVILTDTKKPLANKRTFLLRKKPFIMTQEVSWEELVSNKFQLAFELLDTNKKELMYDEKRKPFTKEVMINFSSL